MSCARCTRAPWRIWCGWASCWAFGRPNPPRHKPPYGFCFAHVDYMFGTAAEVETGRQPKPDANVEQTTSDFNHRRRRVDLFGRREPCAFARIRRAYVLLRRKVP